MWLVCREPVRDNENNKRSASARAHKGTPIKRRVKHSQSARNCDCFEDSPDRNVERNYILSFLAKVKPQDNADKKSAPVKKKNAKNKKGNVQDKNFNEKQKKNKTGGQKKNALKRATSITLERNRIIPLNDGTGGCVLVSQTTTIKETPCAQEEKKANKKEEKKVNKKEERAKRRFNRLFKRVSNVRRKAQEFLMKKKKEMVSKEKVNETAPKPFVEFESIPAQDDFIEESFEEEDESVGDMCDPEQGNGRVSVCSSTGYFTPVGMSPDATRRGSKRFSLALSHASVDIFEDANGDSVDSGHPSITVASIRSALDAAVVVDREEVRRRMRVGEQIYPNCDNSIWMRTCEQEVVDPIRGTTTGMIPVWLKGTLLRNGPGSMQVGDMTFQHLFDSSALLHRFAVNDGEVTYQCRFLKSNTYLKNHEANRIVVNEFGTRAVPDPCQTIFKRVAALFNPGESLSDNAMISVYPFGDEFYCFTESPTIHRIDPNTLETMERVNVSKHVAVVNHTSHPHVMADGTVYNQGMSLRGAVPHYSIIRFPRASSKERRSGQMFESAEVVASVRARWALHPSYMHTFGITDNYYVIVEQPLSVAVPTLVKNQLLGQPMSSCFRFYKDKQTLIHVVERSSGKIHRTYQAEAFFYLHIVNQYESDGHLVIDICCYSDPSMLDCMYYDALKEMNKNPDYARLFRGRPLRFVLPLAPPVADSSTNLVTLGGSAAAAWWRGTDVFVQPELLCNLGCETPRINYQRHLGKLYRYFYAISSDVDLDNPGTLIKVDTLTRSTKTWSEPKVFPSEPIFVPSPDPQAEDDGVILSALVWGRGMERQVGLLILDAASWLELGRTIFRTPSPVPKCLHGWFTSDF